MDNDTRQKAAMVAFVAVFMLVTVGLIGLTISSAFGGGASHTATVVDGGSANVIEDVTVPDSYSFELHLSGPFDAPVREAYVVDDGDVNSITDAVPGQATVQVRLGGLRTHKKGHRYKVVLLDGRGDVVDWALVEVTPADG